MSRDFLLRVNKERTEYDRYIDSKKELEDAYNAWYEANIARHDAYRTQHLDILLKLFAREELPELIFQRLDNQLENSKNGCMVQFDSFHGSIAQRGLRPFALMLYEYERALIQKYIDCYCKTKQKRELESKIEDLEARLAHLEEAKLFEPGGPMFQEAKTSYEQKEKENLARGDYD